MRPVRGLFPRATRENKCSAAERGGEGGGAERKRFPIGLPIRQDRDEARDSPFPATGEETCNRDASPLSLFACYAGNNVESSVIIKIGSIQTIKLPRQAEFQSVSKRSVFVVRDVEKSIFEKRNTRPIL